MSDLEDLLFLLRALRFDLAHKGIREVLDLSSRRGWRSSLRQQPLAFHVFSAWRARHGAPRRSPTLWSLGHLAHLLDQDLAAFLREGRDGDADQLPVVGGREAEVGLLDGPLDVPEGALVVGG